ncbi:MAG: PAS domain S-box protein, partial [Armatimonadetes bacterium]|nr:PAS domain S-box protein [Armatimonadota bacterium]
MSPDTAQARNEEVTHSLQVLVIEDDDTLAGLVCRALERRGWTSAATSTGASACARLAEAVPSLVLLDYSLPDMRAEDVMERIGLLERPPPVIVVTGEGSEQIASRMLGLGVRDYIVKDERFLDRLLHSVEHALQDAARKREVERLQAELAANERRFRALYEEAPLPYQSLDAEGRLIAVNPPWLSLFGYDEHEVVGRPITEFMDPESARRFPSVFDGFRRTGTVTGVEMVLRRRSGEPVLVSVCGRVIFDDQGGFVRTHCILQDITAQRTAEEQARRHEQDYRRIVETAEEGVWVVGPDQRTTFVNARLCAMLGYTRGEMLGTLVSDFVLPEDLADHELRVGLRKQGVSERYERRFVRKDGHVRTVLVSATPIMGEAGEFQGSFAMLTDITEIEARDRALSEAERKTASILRAAPVGIGLVSGGVFREVNDAFCAMLGYSREELLGQNARMIYPSQEEFERVGREKYAQIAVSATGSVETQFVRKDGTILDVVLSSTLLDAGDPTAGVTFTALDISNLKRTERALRDAAEHWRLTFDTVPDLVCVLDPQQRIVTANRAMADRLGVQPDDLVGRHCFEAVHGLAAPPEWCPHLLLDGSATQTADMADPKLGGSFNVTVTPITGPENRVLGSVHVVRDLTKRMEAEREVRRSRDFLDCIINAVADPVFVKDAEHRWVLLNDAECALVGVSREAMLGKTDHDFFPAEQADAFWTMDDTVLKAGGVSSSVESLTDADGRVRTLLTTKSRHVGPEGEKFIVGISKDITELQQAQDEVMRSRSRLESLFRLAQGTFETDQELMNFALEEVISLTGSRFAYAHFIDRGEVDLELFAWSREAREVCEAPALRKYSLGDAGVWADCARILRPVIHNEYQDLPERKGYPEGHVHIERHMSVPVIDEGRVVMIAGVANRIGPYDETDARDFQLYMTEVWHLLRRRQVEFELVQRRDTLEEEVASRTRQLEATVEELDAFSYSVSHDLTTPVRHMDQFGRYLLEDYGAALPEDGRKLVTRIREGADKMRQLIDALLTLSRTSRADLRRRQVDLSALATQVFDDLRAMDPKRNVVAVVEPGIVADCDRDLVRLVLQNLLGNAWKFTSQRSPARIEFGSLIRDGRRECFVRDDGAGFDLPNAPRLFTAFQRYHNP